jgi:hypothetical protein
MCNPSIWTRLLVLFSFLVSSTHSLVALPLSLVEHHHLRLFNIHFSSFFFLAYFPRLLMIPFISLSFFLKLSPYPPHSPPACPFLNISSATYILNSRRLSLVPLYFLRFFFINLIYQLLVFNSPF